MCNVPRPPGRRQGRQRNENRLDGIHGDHIKQEKKTGMIRILFQNPQGLGPINSDHNCQTSKINTLKDIVIKHDIDILGMSEVNKDWGMIPQTETMWSLTDGWFEYRRLVTGLNSLVPPMSRTQFGGTLLLAINRIAFSITSTDGDPRKLGRWTSMLFKGKDQKKCRIICAYCPCVSTGPKSTYALQTIGLAQGNILECPRKQFWVDLKAYIEQCISNEEHLVIMGDWNSEYGEVKRWMKGNGLIDIIQQRHNHDHPPPTCVRSKEDPIDAIFTSEHFKCWRGGFLAFDYLEGDHRGLWCDIPIEYILGYNMPYPTHPHARRLKTQDPRTRKRYLSILHESLKDNDVYQQMKDLYNATDKGWLPTDILQFEDLDHNITNAMYDAERRCRTLKMGAIPWSPLYQRACDKVTYWKLVKKQFECKRSNTRKIISLKKKL